RASPSHGGGQRFESASAYQYKDPSLPSRGCFPPGNGNSVARHDADVRRNCGVQSAVHIALPERFGTVRCSFVLPPFSVGSAPSAPVFPFPSRSAGTLKWRTTLPSTPWTPCVGGKSRTSIIRR